QTGKPRAPAPRAAEAPGRAPPRPPPHPAPPPPRPLPAPGAPRHPPRPPASPPARPAPGLPLYRRGARRGKANWATRVPPEAIRIARLAGVVIIPSPRPGARRGNGTAARAPPAGPTPGKAGRDGSHRPSPGPPGDAREQPRRARRALRRGHVPAHRPGPGLGGHGHPGHGDPGPLPPPPGPVGAGARPAGRRAARPAPGPPVAAGGRLSRPAALDEEGYPR